MSYAKISMTALFVSVGCLLASGSTITRPPHQGDSNKYKIYCAEAAVEINSQSLPKMRAERRSEICQLTPNEFDNLSEARHAAKRFGGVGAQCSCGT